MTTLLIPMESFHYKLFVITINFTVIDNEKHYNYFYLVHIFCVSEFGHFVRLSGKRLSVSFGGNR